MDSRQSTNSNSTIEVTSERDSREVYSFYVQLGIISFVVVASILNLTFNLGEKDVWILLLTSTFGWLLPSPKLKPKISRHLVEAPIILTSNDLTSTQNG